MKTKKYYYVGVMANEVSNSELKFVYDVDNIKNIAYWKTYEELRQSKQAPKLFTKTLAEELTKCLNMNFTLAIVIESFIELK